MYCRMSSFVMRPLDPLPGTWRRSTWLSFAILRTKGEERSRSPCDAASAGCAAGAAADAGDGVAGAGADAAGAGGAAAGALAFAAPPPMTATTVLIWTVLPASTLISESVPLAGDGISA